MDTTETVRFSDNTIKYLTKAGWYPGRSIDISEIEQTLTQIGFDIFPAAQAFWREFDGIDYVYQYADSRGGCVGFEALLAGEPPFEKFKKSMEDVSQPLCPIGMRAGEVEIFAIDPDSRIYGIEGGIGLYCDSPDYFIENLPKGRNAIWAWTPKPKKSIFVELFARLAKGK